MSAAQPLTHVVRIQWPDGQVTALELHRDSASGLVFGVEDGFSSQGEGNHPVIFSPYSGRAQIESQHLAVAQGEELATRMRSF